MPEQQIRCRSVLTDAGWLNPAVIDLDSNGYIRSVAPLPENATVDYGHVIPGMPNLHSHAFQRQMAGLSGLASGLASPEGDSFWTWRELMYRLALCIQPEQVLAIAAFLQAEMLENGYTSCAEFHYLHHQPDGKPYADLAEMSGQILAAAEQSGMALTLLPVLYCRSGFGSLDVTARQRRFRNSTGQYLELWQRCTEMLQGQTLHRLGLAPHSLRAVSAEQLAEMLQAFRNVDQPIHIHIAEQQREVEESVAAVAARPVQWLLDHHDVDHQWCLVHATHMDARESSAVLRSHAVAGLCPSTEADLGDGYFDIINWFAQSGRFGVGSDSNLRLSPTEELRTLEFQARLQSGKRNVLSEQELSCGRSLWQRSLAGGAQALGQKVGRMAPTYRADLIELDEQHPLLAGRCGDSLLDSWIMAGEQTMVRTVWVGGQKRVVEGRHVARDVLLAAGRKAMRELL